MQFDLNLVNVDMSSSLATIVLYRYVDIILIAITHFENYEIFDSLSPIVLQPPECLSPSTEVEDSSTLGNLILFEL